MEPGPGNAPLFKRSTRVPLEAVVRLHFEGTVAYQNGFAANVSATGMFVKYPDPPPVGTKLVFEFTIGQLRRPVQGVGRVVWVREKYEGPGKPAGVGIEFAQLDAQSREHIAEALFEYLEESLGNEMLDLPSLSSEEARDESAHQDTEPQLPIFAPRVEEEAAPGFEPLMPPPPESFAAPAESPPPFGAAPPLSFPMAPPPADEERRPRVAPPAPAPPALAAAAPSPSPERRAAVARRTRARFPWPWLAALAILAGGGFAVWKLYLEPEPPPPPPAARRAAPTPAPKPTRPPLPANPGPGGTLAETVGTSSTPPDATRPPVGPAPPESVDGGAVSATDAAPAAGVTPTPAAGGEDQAVPVEPLAAAGAATSGSAALKQVEASPAPPAAPEPEIKSLPRATGVASIDWTEATGITIITVSGDGPFADGTVHWYEIGGDAPRLLLKLQSVGRAFGKGTLTVGTAAVRTIRNAAHPGAGGGEVHIVIDLATPAPKLQGVEIAGSRIVVKLAAAR